MKVSSKIVKDINWKTFDAMKSNLETMGTVRVGVPKSAGPEADGTPMALVAAVHEFGAPTHGIVERPFLRNTIRNNQDKYVRLNKINILKVLRGDLKLDKALGILGAVAQGDVQQFISQNDYELKPKTIARKKSTRALVDTGNLKGSIVWVIGDKDA